jgi:uncharacterized RmlC-like cupin family protein
MRLRELAVMWKIAHLRKRDRVTVQRLAEGQAVSVDRVTGLFHNVRDQFFAEHPRATGVAWEFGTTTVNGKIPPGNPQLPLADVVTVMDEVVGYQQILVQQGTRQAGARASIHVHQYGATTFVIGGRGADTDFSEGHEPNTYPKGSYYYMPASTPMTPANLTDRDVRVMNVFVLPVGIPGTTFIEPGAPGFNPA